MFSYTIAAILLDLTLTEVLANIPRDAGAIVVYVLLGAFAYFVWQGSRSSTVARYTGGAKGEGDGEDKRHGKTSATSARSEDPRPAA